MQSGDKGAGPVRRDQYRLFLLEYPHLAARMTQQRMTDQKRPILVRHLLPEVEIETIRMVVNHPKAGAVEPFENAANEEIVHPVMEDVGVVEERGHCHAASREVLGARLSSRYLSIYDSRSKCWSILTCPKRYEPCLEQTKS